MDDNQMIRAETDPETRKIVRESLTTDAGEFLTICEQLRFIYDLVHGIEDETLREEITERLVDAFQMGKKMNSRLARYKRETGDPTGSRGSNLIKLKDVAQRKELRRNR